MVEDEVIPVVEGGAEAVEEVEVMLHLVLLLLLVLRLLLLLRPPPPPPPPAPAAAAHAVATGTIAGEDSPAARTRRQVQLAINRVHHDAALGGGGRRRQREGDIDSPSTRTRQRLAAATHVSHAGGTGANAARLMRQLFSSNQPADTGTDDPISDDDNDGDDDEDEEEPYEEEEDPAVANVAAVAAAPQVQEPVQYGRNRLTAVGRDWLLEKCVKENLFPRIKFADLDFELAFSNEPESVCRFMAEKMNVQEENVERWWKGAVKGVHNKLKTNRNNVIKAIQTRFHGKSKLIGCCDNFFFLTPPFSCLPQIIY